MNLGNSKLKGNNRTFFAIVMSDIIYITFVFFLIFTDRFRCFLLIEIPKYLAFDYPRKFCI